MNPMKGGYQQLYVERVMQANTGADLDFLTGCRGDAIPPPVALVHLSDGFILKKRMKRIS